MLGEDGVFDRAEERRMDPQPHNRGKHQHDGKSHLSGPGKQQPGASDPHDPEFHDLDGADDPGLVHRVGELPRERRKQKEGQDKQGSGECVEEAFLRFAGEDLICGEQDHRCLEQIVVEGSEELRDEERQKSPLLEEPEGIDHGGKSPGCGRIEAGIAVACALCQPCRPGLRGTPVRLSHATC